MAPPIRPRFVLRSVTGFHIDSGVGRTPSRAPQTSWTVADSWLNYRQAYESRAGAIGEQSARRICAWLEARAFDELPPGHGMQYRYSRHGCRCDHCTAASTYAKYERQWRQYRQRLAA